MRFRTRAGQPYATQSGGIDFVTTDPAPTTQASPMLTPAKMVTLPPIQQSLPMTMSPPALESGHVGSCRFAGSNGGLVNFVRWWDDLQIELVEGINASVQSQNDGWDGERGALPLRAIAVSRSCGRDHLHGNGDMKLTLNRDRGIGIDGVW